MVLAGEVGGRWSAETTSFPRLLAEARARPPLGRRVEQPWRIRRGARPRVRSQLLCWSSVCLLGQTATRLRATEWVRLPCEECSDDFIPFHSRRKEGSIQFHQSSFIQLTVSSTAFFIHNSLGKARKTFSSETRHPQLTHPNVSRFRRFGLSSFIFERRPPPW